MKASPCQDPDLPSIEQHVARLASLLSAILQSCNVGTKLLADRLAELAEAVDGPLGGSPVWASPHIHLACTQLVFVWRRDPMFLDAEGNAKPLIRAGEFGSFATLCERAAPTYSSETLLEYLANLGGVRELEDGTIQLLTESVLACVTQPEHAVAPETVLMHLQGFLGSVEFNLLRRHGDPPPRFERACYGRIPSRLVPVFQQLVATRGQNFIDSIDEWLDRHHAATGSDSEVSGVGAGAYMLFYASKRME